MGAKSPQCPLEGPRHDVWPYLRDGHKPDLAPEGLEQAQVYTGEGLATSTATPTEGVHRSPSNSDTVNSYNPLIHTFGKKWSKRPIY